MKIRLLPALAGLAISLAMPTFAQQPNTPDPQLRKQIEAHCKQHDDAFNSNDAAALAPFYTEDAVLVVPEGPVYGREAIAKFWVDLFQKVHFSNHLGTLDQYSPHIIGTAGHEVWEIGRWSQTVKGENFGPIEQKGYWSGIVVREGDVWKFRLHAVTFAAPEPPQTK
jgi:ketosteroid isomerase-like protein